MIIRGFEDLKKENARVEDQPRQIPWSREVLRKSAGDKSPWSNLRKWWEDNSFLRSQGLENEIDLNEIKSAARGVKNKWFSRVVKYPDVFRAAINGNSCDWEAIKNVEEV